MNRKIVILLPILLFLAAIFILSCDRNAGMVMNTIPSGPPTFTELANVMNANCAFSGCHGGVATNPPGGPMNLSLGQAYGNIVNVPATQMPVLFRIQPGSPDSSYLYRKLTGVGIQGVQMPPGGNPNVSPQVVDRFRQWILLGAPNN